MNHTLLETTPENVRKIHGMMLEILDPVHQLFAKNNIRYIAAYGTLLGIVREDGFIKMMMISILKYTRMIGKGRLTF